ncbi:MAG: hypothetical protein IPH49_15775 [Ignavibacteria bacterium]|nr:hypothetical protein [Ignavibacteria bacterium]
MNGLYKVGSQGLLTRVYDSTRDTWRNLNGNITIRDVTSASSTGFLPQPQAHQEAGKRYKH